MSFIVNSRTPTIATFGGSPTLQEARDMIGNLQRLDLCYSGTIGRYVGGEYVVVEKFHKLDEEGRSPTIFRYDIQGHCVLEIEAYDLLGARRELKSELIKRGLGYMIGSIDSMEPNIYRYDDE